MFARRSEKGCSKLTRAEEAKLVADARAGCEDAVRGLVDAHKDRLFAFVWRILRNHDDAEDICQEALVRAFTSLDSFSSEFRFSTWLFTIGYRLCLNHLRRRKSLTGELDFTMVPSGDPDVADRIAESEEAARLKDKIWEAVDRLSVPQRAAVLLYYREGWSCESISQSLGIPTATAKSHLHRARARLRDSLATLVEDWSQVQALREAVS